MLKMKEKIIFYLLFAKSKLNPNCLEHRKAKEEISQILRELEAKDDYKQ